jgi:hypothetical protein
MGVSTCTEPYFDGFIHCDVCDSQIRHQRLDLTVEVLQYGESELYEIAESEFMRFPDTRRHWDANTQGWYCDDCYPENGDQEEHPTVDRVEHARNDQHAFLIRWQNTFNSTHTGEAK